MCALTDNQISNYWVSSGKYDSIFTYIRYNIDEIQNDLTLMFAGEKIPSGIQEYAATSLELKSKEEIYSAMVVYGLLTYDNGMVFIPNKELMGSYAAMMKKRNPWDIFTGLQMCHLRCCRQLLQVIQKL